MIHTIVFEGVDRCGKTTMMLEFNKKTNYKYICYDRGLISYLAYAKIHERNNFMPIKAFLPSLRHTLFVFIDVRQQTITDRVILTGHIRFDVSEHVQIFRRISEVLKLYSQQMIVVQNENIDDRAESIKKIRSYLKSHKYEDWIKRR